MAQEFHTLTIIKKQKESSDSFSFYLDIPEGLKENFKYAAGQYVTISCEIEGEEYRRSYSMSSSPSDEFLRISVKVVPSGRVSPFLAHNVQEGDQLHISEPEGKFSPNVNDDESKLYFLIGAGSGITPLMSIMRLLAEKDPRSRVVLLYGSRNEKDIMFKDELEKLSTEYEGQIFVHHTISQPSLKKKSGIGGLLGMKSSEWSGMKGRIDRLKLFMILDQHIEYSKNQQFFLCGPAGMIDNCTMNLKTRGIKQENIYREYFTVGENSVQGSSNIIDNAELQVTLDKEVMELSFLPGKSLLETLLENGKQPPYSCTSGACSTCVAKLTEGKVHMDVCLALDQDEIDNNLILTCQSYALSEKVCVDFDFS